MDDAVKGWLGRKSRKLQKLPDNAIAMAAEITEWWIEGWSAWGAIWHNAAGRRTFTPPSPSSDWRARICVCLNSFWTYRAVSLFPSLNYTNRIILFVFQGWKKCLTVGHEKEREKIGKSNFVKVWYSLNKPKYTERIVDIYTVLEIISDFKAFI